MLARGDLLDVTVESYDRCLATNLRGTFFLTQAVARRMLQVPPAAGAGPRSIVTITSVNAEIASISRGEYCISKAGASMLTRLFALRLAAHGIAVYEVRPGVIRTAMTAPVAERYQAEIDGRPVADRALGRARRHRPRGRDARDRRPAVQRRSGGVRGRGSEPAGVLTGWNGGGSRPWSASSWYSASPSAVGIHTAPGPLAQPRGAISPAAASSSTAGPTPKWRSSIPPEMPRTGRGIEHSRSRIR